MFGEHDIIPATRGLPSVPGLYGKNKDPNYELTALALHHFNILSLYEQWVAPAAAVQRKAVADKHDPEQQHRFGDQPYHKDTAATTAFAGSLSASFVIEGHDDSGVPGALETVAFLNRNGPLPAGHRWLFAVGGHVHPLPTVAGEAAMFFIKGEGVGHGTLPTSSNEPSCKTHGNIGSALVTKRSMIQSLDRAAGTSTRTPCTSLE